jgi:hypothetical protein
MSDERPMNDDIPHEPDRDPVEGVVPTEDPQTIGRQPELVQHNQTNMFAFCSRCGQSREGLSENSPCQSCDALPNDPKCTFCGYTLTGLNVNEKCPECGKPIWDSNISLPTSGYSITSMVLGIVGIISCMIYGIPSLIFGSLALIFSHLGRKQMRNGERAGATNGFCITGFWTGIAGIVIGAIYACFIVYFIMNHI